MNTRFETGEGDTISFIDSRYKQSKNRNLNTRFTSGKEHRIVSIQLRHIFSLDLYKEHQSPTIIVIYFSSSLTIYIYASIKRKCRNKSSDFPSYFGLIQVQCSQKFFANVGLADHERWTLCAD